MDSTTRRQPCERQTLLTGGPEEGQSFGKKFCAVYFIVVLIVGVALETTTSDQNCLVMFWFRISVKFQDSFTALLASPSP
jgi:hypothetical protein